MIAGSVSHAQGQYANIICRRSENLQSSRQVHLEDQETEINRKV